MVEATLASNKGGGATVASNVDAMTAGVWRCATLRWDGSTIRFCVNGIAAGSPACRTTLGAADRGGICEPMALAGVFDRRRGGSRQHPDARASVYLVILCDKVLFILLCFSLFTQLSAGSPSGSPVAALP